MAAAANTLLVGDLNLAASKENIPAAVPTSGPPYICPPCGIRFSSPSTLEAHCTYYCSHRVNNKDQDDDSCTTMDGKILANLLI